MLVKKKHWSELTPLQQGGIVILAIIQISLLVGALWDIRRRPANQINGSQRQSKQTGLDPTIFCQFHRPAGLLCRWAEE